MRLAAAANRDSECHAHRRHSRSAGGGMNVIIENKHIASIGTNEAIPPGAEIVDGKGKFAIPGLQELDSLLEFVAKEAPNR
jgi:imidazolonepropionase-like amidohydrolase